MRTDAFSCCYYLVKYPELTHFCRWLSRHSIAPDGSDSASALLFGRQEEYLERLQGNCISQSGQSEKRGKRVMCFPIFCFLLVKIYAMRKIPHSHFWNAIPSDLGILQGSQIPRFVLWCFIQIQVSGKSKIPWFYRWTSCAEMAREKTQDSDSKWTVDPQKL